MLRTYLLVRHLHPLVSITQNLDSSVTLADMTVVVVASISIDMSCISVDRRIEMRDGTLVFALGVLGVIAHCVSGLSKLFHELEGNVWCTVVD
jgi:hypothetical protein